MPVYCSRRVSVLSNKNNDGEAAVQCLPINDWGSSWSLFEFKRKMVNSEAGEFLWEAQLYCL